MFIIITSRYVPEGAPPPPSLCWGGDKVTSVPLCGEQYANVVSGGPPAREGGEGEMMPTVGLATSACFRATCATSCNIVFYPRRLPCDGQPDDGQDHVDG